MLEKKLFKVEIYDYFDKAISGLASFEIYRRCDFFFIKIEL
jgi:hypothetical protein